MSDTEDTEVVLTGHSSTNEGVQVSLHPLPLLNISEHYTRVRIQRGQDDVKVIGALIGVQQGREVEITNSFELALSDDGTEVNQQFFTDRQSQFKQVFPTFEFLGWYTVGSTPTALDLSLHTQLLAHNESPIFLTLSPSAISSTVKGSTLPIAIYESVVDIVGGKSVNKFVKIAGGEHSGYKIETGEAERIAVESASRQAVASTSGTKGGQESSESTLVAGLSTQRNAIQMLHSRIGVILEYLSNVHKGVIPADHETLRQISALVSSISATSPDSKTVEPEASFAAEFEHEQNDVLLTTILGQMTRNLESTNVLMDKFGITQQRGEDDMMMGPGGGRKGGGRGGPLRAGPGGRRGGSDFGFF